MPYFKPIKHVQNKNSNHKILKKEKCTQTIHPNISAILFSSVLTDVHQKLKTSFKTSITHKNNWRQIKSVALNDTKKYDN